MSTITRQIAPDQARKTADNLRELGITVPADVRAHLDRLDALEADKPTHPDTADLIAAYRDGASDDEVHEMTMRLLTADHRRNAWNEARIKEGQAAAAAFTGNGDDLTRQLAKQAAPLIEKLENVAQIDTLDTTVLIRAGRTAEAEEAARAEIVAGDLSALYALRDRITQGASYGVGPVNCGRWRDPRALTAALNQRRRQPSTLDGFLIGIRAEAGLWFPTPGEAEAQAKPAAKEEEHKAQVEREQRRGGVVAFSG